MIHSIPLKIKINQHQITSIFGLQSILNFFFFPSLFFYKKKKKNYAATFENANYTTRNGGRQRTNTNENGIKFGKL